METETLTCADEGRLIQHTGAHTRYTEWETHVEADTQTATDTPRKARLDRHSRHRKPQACSNTPPWCARCGWANSETMSDTRASLYTHTHTHNHTHPWVSSVSGTWYEGKQSGSKNANPCLVLTLSLLFLSKSWTAKSGGAGEIIWSISQPLGTSRS